MEHFILLREMAIHAHYQENMGNPLLSSMHQTSPTSVPGKFPNHNYKGIQIPILSHHQRFLLRLWGALHIAW